MQGNVDLMTICTRVMISDGIIRRSFAGATLRARNGSVHTFLFDNRDTRVSVQLRGSGDRDDFMAIYHVFIGRFLELYPKLDFEIFRFHGDCWPAYMDDADLPKFYGEEVHREHGDRTRARHGFEHLGGFYLTDSMHLSAGMQAGQGFAEAQKKMTPDADEYRQVAQHIPHPGLYHSTDDAEMMESWMADNGGASAPMVM